jgi:hypothetical protein
MALGTNAIGIQSSLSPAGLSKSGGATPTMVKGEPSRTSVDSRTSGEAKRRCQSPWLRTTALDLPGAPSSGRKPRPTTGTTPTTEKKLAVTTVAGISSTASVLFKVIDVGRCQAAIPSKTRLETA